MSVEAVLANKQAWSVVQGDALAGLRSLPSNSVHCVVTSIPYYGLRSYGTEPQVWGGSVECSHEWGTAGRPHHPGQVPQTNMNGRGNALAVATGQQAASGAFCQLCGAWRGEYGSEPTPVLFIEHTVSIFSEVRRVLHPTGVLWLNIGDSYSGAGYSRQDNTGGAKREQGGKQRHTPAFGLGPKQLLMMPARVAIALQDDGWILRADCIWHKPNPMPESVTDRPTKAHEYVYLFSKQERYYYDSEAVKERVGEPIRLAASFRDGGVYTNNRSLDNSASKDKATHGDGDPSYSGRNLRSVWSIATNGYADAHFATFPTELPRRCIAAGSSEHGVCAACGAPWARVVERGELVPQSDRAKYEWSPDKIEADPSLVRGVGMFEHGVKPGWAYENKTTGWQPSCACNAPTVPALVLDPFGGAGTTSLVARRLNRRALSFELNADYCAMARRRIMQDAPLFNALQEQPA